MKSPKMIFDESHVLHELAHYLPSQAPLKDFVHHNTLHAFQYLPFHDGLTVASRIFGYQVYEDLQVFRDLYKKGEIDDTVLDRVLRDRKGGQHELWKNKLLHEKQELNLQGRIGQLREIWRSKRKVNIDKYVHPTLFRLTASYLDQGVAIWQPPKRKSGLLASVRNIERHSFISIFKSDRARDLIMHTHLTLEHLLEIVVGREAFFEHYLFDMSFAHPGWSGMVSMIELQPESLLDKREISLKDFIMLELLLEIDVLEQKIGNNFKPLASDLDTESLSLFGNVEKKEIDIILALWQEAREWSFYDTVLKGLSMGVQYNGKPDPEFQAYFCLDDRESSLRTYLENEVPCETFGTAGFFNVAFYFQPEHGKFHTKVCPAPVTPVHLVKESEAKLRHKKDSHFNKHAHGFFGGLLATQTMGFVSALKLTASIFRPTDTPAMVSSFRHMDKNGNLSIEEKGNKNAQLQIGFTTEEMADRLEGLFKSTGLVNFAPLVYIIGHGASSVNNTYYAGYDCGACSGRAGSVNARVVADMANRKEVRAILADRGLLIAKSTQFVGGLHDTTRDEIEFYDVSFLSNENKIRHEKNVVSFSKALDLNAKERSRRFLYVNTNEESASVHDKVKLRAMSLFEPRPEWNHATNTLCIVGKRENNEHLFLDRRAFLQSYDPKLDPNGDYLLNILKAVAPVCGGINLEYYFSRVDNQRLGAGSKLPHNVIGLIGVNNGMEGDLRPGLPQQMVNIHDPLRLLVTVEQIPALVLTTIQRDEATYEWFKNEWVWLVAVHPESKELYVFRNGTFEKYDPICSELPTVKDVSKLVEGSHENIPVHIML